MNYLSVFSPSHSQLFFSEEGDVLVLVQHVFSCRRQENR